MGLRTDGGPCRPQTRKAAAHGATVSTPRRARARAARPWNPPPACRAFRCSRSPASPLEEHVRGLHAARLAKFTIEQRVGFRDVVLMRKSELLGGAIDPTAQLGFTHKDYITKSYALLYRELVLMRKSELLGGAIDPTARAFQF